MREPKQQPVRSALASVKSGYGILVGLFVVGFGVGCSREVEQVEPPPVEVIAAEAKERFVPIYGEYIGVTEASLFVEIRARIDGYIQEVHFEEGRPVKKDDLLYVIDPRPFEAAVNKAEAQLSRAKAAAAKCSRDTARLEPLYKQGAASQLDFDNAITAQENADADIQIAEAELATAQLELGYTEIRAPMDGYVGRSRIDIGALVGSKGQSLLTVVQKIEPMYVNFSMTALDYITARRREAEAGEDEDDESKPSPQAKEHQHILITLPDDTPYAYRGEVQFTDPQIDPDTGTFQVRAVFPNPDRLLLPGLHTQVRVLLQYRPDAILVPQKSIQVEQGGAYVFVVMPDDTVERRFIVGGAALRDRMIVEQGLAEGDRVVIEGMHKLRPGTRVKLVEPPDDPPTTTPATDADSGSGRG